MHIYKYVSVFIERVPAINIHTYMYSSSRVLFSSIMFPLHCRRNLRGCLKLPRRTPLENTNHSGWSLSIGSSRSIYTYMFVIAHRRSSSKPLSKKSPICGTNEWLHSCMQSMNIFVNKFVCTNTLTCTLLQIGALPVKLFQKRALFVGQMSGFTPACSQ